MRVGWLGCAENSAIKVNECDTDDCDEAQVLNNCLDASIQ